MLHGYVAERSRHGTPRDQRRSWMRAFTLHRAIAYLGELRGSVQVPNSIMAFSFEDGRGFTCRHTTYRSILTHRIDCLLRLVTRHTIAMPSTVDPF